MPKRWRIVSSGGTARLGIASGGMGGPGGQSGNVKILICLDGNDCIELPWRWNTKQEARQAIEGSGGWKKANVDD